MALSAFQNNFTAGEISPRLYGRGDLTAYKNGLAALQNMVVWRHGGITRRMGSVYLRDAAATGDRGRLTVYRDADADSVPLEFVDGAINAFDTQGGVLETISAPYSGDAIQRLKFAQSGAALWIVESGYAPRRLTRLSGGGFNLTAPSLLNDPFTAGDWPQAVGFYEQRLVFAATQAQPQTLWFSKLANETDFTQGALADDAITFTIAADDGGTIRWLSPQRKMFVGASNGVWVVDAFDPSLGLAPDNISARRHTRTAAAQGAPRAVADGVLFVQRGGTKLRALTYRMESNGFAARELSLMSEHLLRQGLRAIDYQEEPDEIVWALREDDRLVGFTFDSDQGVSAWHDHSLGGDAAEIESFCCPDGVESDALWLLVRRSVGGVTRRWIEALAPQFRPADPHDLDGMIYLDAAQDWRGEAMGDWVVASQSGELLSLQRVSGGRALIGGDVGSVWRMTAGDVDGFGELTIIAVDGADAFTARWAQTPPNGLASAAALTAMETAETLTGLERFEGAAVAVVADGATHPERTVIGGAISLQRRAVRAVVGFAYESVVETLDVAAREAPPAGSRTKRTHRVDLDLMDSLGGRVGPAGQSGAIDPIRGGDDDMDGPPALFSGVRSILVPAGHGPDGRIRIVQDLPLPFTLRGLTARMEITD